MNKRIFDFTSEDIRNAGREQILNAIERSEGRTIMAETIVTAVPSVDVVSNAELAACFGADMITLNLLDLNNPFAVVNQHDAPSEISIEHVRDYTGRLLGCNLEPVPAEMAGQVNSGRVLSRQTVRRAVDLGMNYIMITGNPGMKVTQQTIVEGIREARSVSEDIIIIAGKMHGSGVGNDYDLSVISLFKQAGADIVLFPAPYTTPGVSPELAARMMEEVHRVGLLGMLAIGTSQEGSSESYIERVAMESKAAGADIVHIGDSGYSGLALPENIVRLGITLRGRRHQYKRMANRR
ncbi:DUF7916 family protein [Vibrio sp. SCSIO 43137]|uniref:DUF7916 family protein n=1 Tax=Vibrio sp. SCSIO 43137 TaxID=3021011 RepID=UPI00230753D2|nr:dihydrodipicolinate synthase [Vibrio sp. SCSIO 43137]WCE28875.1 dihydrodipicolinate synthase [Vibrio sp. SCSIO 43137]